MNPNETSASGTGPIFYDREQAERPGTSSFNLMESSSIFSTSPDHQEPLDIFLNTDESNSTLCHIFQSRPSSPNDSIPWNDIFFSPPRDHGSTPSMVSPVSTYSCPTMPSTPEDAEALNAVEGAKSAIDSNSGNCINVSNPENSVLPAALSKPGCSRTCPGCVRSASACHDAHRLTASEVAIQQKFFKGVTKKKNSDKWTGEIRISKKLPKDSKLKAKGKLWLGTFETPCQAARALHMGKFFLSEKKNSATDALNIEQSSKTTLSYFKDLMRAKPLDEKLLDTVKDIATDYGKNGSVTVSFL